MEYSKEGREMRKKAVMAVVLAMALVLTPMSGRQEVMAAEATNAVIISNLI